MKVQGFIAICLLSFAMPIAASAQTAGPISIQGAVGTQTNGWGDHESVSIGVWPGDHVGLLAGVERIHLPTRITRHDNGQSAERGGTSTFVSGELRLSPRPFSRVAPYGLAGAGIGTARVNVNETFPGPATSDRAGYLFFGGGVSVPITEHLSTFADLRFILQVTSGEADVFLFKPVRAGLSWRF